jgi:hypothetical protein
MADTLGILMARRTKRLWTVEEKRSICRQTTVPGVSWHRWLGAMRFVKSGARGEIGGAKVDHIGGVTIALRAA